MEYKLMIKEIRLERGMTQEELAEKADIHQTYISDLENVHNRKSPTLKTIIQIAEALGVCPYALMHFDIPCDKNCLSYCNDIFLP